jgi:YHS domain-containing protein
MTIPALPASHRLGTVKDPVCGMDGDPARARHTITYEGKNYFFCSANCLEKFRREPRKYLARGSGGGHEPKA